MPSQVYSPIAHLDFSSADTGPTSLQTCLFVVLYISTAVALPLTSKLIYTGPGDGVHFNYPLTVSFLQLLAVGLILCLFDTLRHFYYSYRFRKPSIPNYASSINYSSSSVSSFPSAILGWRYASVSQDSWIFGPNFTVKLKGMFLPSFFFAAVISLTNLGIQSAPVNIHLILRASCLIWIMIFSLFLKNERPALIQVAFAFIVLVGEVLLGYDVTAGFNSSTSIPVSGLIFNLSSALAIGLNLVTLRSACLKLRPAPLRMDLIQISAFKLTMSAVLIVPFVLVVEGFHTFLSTSKVASWTYLLQQSSDHINEIVLLMAIGAAVTLIYQTCIVGLASAARATTVGLLQDSSTLPQLLVFAALSKVIPSSWNITAFSFTSLHLAGTICVSVGVGGYALSHWIVQRRKDKELDDQTWIMS